MTTAFSRKNTVKEYFSAQSEYWESLYNESAPTERFPHFELARRKQIIFELIADLPRAGLHTALDVGCGSGQYLAELARLGIKSVGVDISEEMLNLTRRKLDALPGPTVSLLHADCCDLPLESDSFDLILCIGLLEYLEQESAALQEIHRLVAHDGHVIVTLPNLWKLRNLVNPYYYLVRIWVYFFGNATSTSEKENPQNFDYRRSSVTRYSLPRAKRILRRSGFTILDVRSCCFGPFSLWKPYHSPGTSMRTSNCIEGLLKCRIFGFLNFFSNRWIMLLRPTAAGSSEK